MRTEKNEEKIFTSKPTIFLHLSNFKKPWFISIFKHINQICTWNRKDLQQKIL